MATDPIWAAIKEWQRAGRIHRSTFKREDGWNAKTRATCGAYHATARKMARTVPVTREGASALINHMIYDIDRGDNNWQVMGLRSVRRYLRGN
jgi:hypothetical protein